MFSSWLRKVVFISWCFTPTVCLNISAKHQQTSPDQILKNGLKRSPTTSKHIQISLKRYKIHHVSSTLRNRFSGLTQAQEELWLRDVQFFRCWYMLQTFRHLPAWTDPFKRQLSFSTWFSYDGWNSKWMDGQLDFLSLSGYDGFRGKRQKHQVSSCSVCWQSC